MKVTIHQPYYLPYIGLFHKILQCDCFVIYDTAQYVKNRLDNRNYIKFNNQKTLLTVPVGKKSSFKRLHEVKIGNKANWHLKHWTTIEMAYNNSPWFKDYSEQFRRHYMKNNIMLVDINIPLILEVLDILNWKGKIIKSSELGLDYSLLSTVALIEILKKVNGTYYLAGASSKKYLQEDLFDRENITVEYHQFSHPEYTQQNVGFIPNLACIDLIFNEAERSKKIIIGD